MLHHLRETLGRIPAPRRYGRIMALLLASLGGAVDVFSAGPDGEANTADDITNWSLDKKEK